MRDRESQSQAGRPGLGCKLGSSAAGRKIDIWVGSQEAGGAGRMVWTRSQRWRQVCWWCRQGGPAAGGAGRDAGGEGRAGGSLPALSVVLKRGPAGSTVLATAPRHRPHVGTGRAAWGAVPGKATRDLTARLILSH